MYEAGGTTFAESPRNDYRDDLGVSFAATNGDYTELDCNFYCWVACEEEERFWTYNGHSGKTTYVNK